MSKDHVQSATPFDVLRRVAEGTLGRGHSFLSPRWKALLDYAESEGVTAQMIYSSLRDEAPSLASDPRSVVERVAEIIDGAEQTTGDEGEYVRRKYDELINERDWWVHQTGTETSAAMMSGKAARLLRDVVYPNYFQEQP